MLSVFRSDKTRVFRVGLKSKNGNRASAHVLIYSCTGLYKQMFIQWNFLLCNR